MRPHDVAESGFQFHGLDEEVVIGVDAVSTAGGFEVEAQPLLQPKPNCASVCRKNSHRIIISAILPIDTTGPR
jgi:hypothetical protein